MYKTKVLPEETKISEEPKIVVQSVMFPGLDPSLASELSKIHAKELKGSQNQKEEWIPPEFKEREYAESQLAKKGGSKRGKKQSNIDLPDELANLIPQKPQKTNEELKKERERDKKIEDLLGRCIAHHIKEYNYEYFNKLSDSELIEFSAELEGEIEQKMRKIAELPRTITTVGLKTVEMAEKMAPKVLGGVTSIVQISEPEIAKCIETMQKKGKKFGVAEKLIEPEWQLAYLVGVPIGLKVLDNLMAMSGSKNVSVPKNSKTSSEEPVKLPRQSNVTSRSLPSYPPSSPSDSLF
jgi:hypothetical protein